MKHILASLAAFLTSLAVASAQHPLTPFGYESMKNSAGYLAKGASNSRKDTKCLVILLDDDKNPGTDFDPGRGKAYYENLLFNAAAIRNNSDLTTPSGSINRCLMENSNGRFQLIPAVKAAHPNGVIGPLQTTNAESDAIAADATAHLQGYIALDVACRNGFVLKDFDADNNNIVTDEELILIVVKTRKQGSGGESRFVSAHIPSGQPVARVASFTGSFVGADEQIDFDTLAHEITHNYGTDDIYAFGRRHPSDLAGSAVVNDGLTLMAGTISAEPFYPAIYHLDCWHKMCLGWAEPQLVSLKAGGVFTLTAPQVGGSSNAVLLHDPAKGPGEYFMLEYRTSAVNAATTYDGQLKRSGVLLWHIQMDPIFATSDSQRAINVVSTLNLVVGTPLQPDSILNGVWTEGPPYPNGDIGVANAWTGGMTSHYLRWNDGNVTKCRFRVRPFSMTDQSVAVEILAEQDTWVDFTWNGVQNGGQFSPYKTFAAGVANAGWGGRVRLKTGGVDVAPLSILDRSMTISAESSPVTINRP